MGHPMRSHLTLFKNGQNVGEGRWDGRGNIRTASDEVNWDYCCINFDTAVCKTKGGKVLVVKKDKRYERR
jgi:hypothetical protein